MAVSAAKYLVCFDKTESSPPPDRTPPPPIIAEPPPLEEVDSTEQIEEAYQRGREEGFASAREAFEAELAEERRRLEQEMATGRSQWVQEVVERLERQIPAAFEAIEAQIAESISRVLRPAIFAAVREEMISSLAANLRKLRSGEGAPLITVSGPSELLDNLRERAPELENSIEFVPGQTVEVKAIADQTVLDSQIQAWSSMLEMSGRIGG
jgi:hypothetical protein